MDLVELNELATRERRAMKPTRVLCCTSTGCQSAGALTVAANMEKQVQADGLTNRVQVVPVGCMGFCGNGPLVEVATAGAEGRLYEFVTPETSASIIRALDCSGQADAPLGDLNHPFFTRQVRIVRDTSGRIHAEKIEEYIAEGGYQGLQKAIAEHTPAEVVEEITKSGLRGRGGAGYPTGLKWATIAKMPPGQKYVICNGDEGDPGAFMDRSVMESDPHRVLEGMAIAAYAVGANQGFIYVRAEYPLAISRLQIAIRQANRLGLLGTGIFDSPFNFRVDLRIGAGAFVCGEETALIASVEGKRGMPKPRPPYPAEKGLWDCPTLINNVETFANIAPIMNKGGDWFASIGTAKSKGTKIFALAGKIRNTGLIEVPMGLSLRTIIEEMGGGSPTGAIKAVQTGGPSGGCIPASLLDTPVDFESLQALGSIMGSGGMIVMDDTSSMVDVAKYFMEFCMDESCGKCIPCRAGTVQMHTLLDKIAKGDASGHDLETLEDLCDMVRNTSLCGLGQSAPNPVLSTLRYFRSEYEQKIRRVGLPMAHPHAMNSHTH
jgi:bidirectional [NiFe] hydrogenase diaphorase subunit